MNKRMGWMVALLASLPATALADTTTVTQTISPSAGKPTVPASEAASTEWKLISNLRSASVTTLKVGLLGMSSTDSTLQSTLTKAQAELASVLQQYADATGTTFQIMDMSGQTAPTTENQGCGSKNFNLDIMIIVGNSSYGSLSSDSTSSGNHGVTKNTSTSGVVKCSVITVNGFTTWATANWSTTEKSVGHTLLHEMGHALGLDHPTNAGNVMNNGVYTYANGTKSDKFTNTLTAGDLYGLYKALPARR